MASRSFEKWRFSLLALVLAGAIAYAQWRGWLPEEGAGAGRPATEKTSPGGSSGRPRSAKPPDSSKNPGTWVELRGCTLVEDRANDGDSFVVRHEGREHTIRLYFADSPEKYRHQYNGDRLAEQGRYFGGLTEQETVGVGEAARDFSLGLLRAGGFSVLTRWEQVFDSERHYAFVTVPRGDLAELLVEEGLARIHTKGVDRPGGEEAAAEKRRLLTMERKARSTQRGAWGR